MKIYLMRHGQTVWNKIGIIQGYSHNRLSKEGKNQVEIKAQKYKDVKFDFIISSPLCRTIQTSNIMNKYHHVKVIKDERIAEIGQGIYTGRHINSMSDEDWKNYNQRLDGFEMEPFESLFSRCQDFADQLKRDYPDKTILVVTHRCVAKILYYIFKNIPFTKQDMVSQELFNNADVEEVEI